MLVRSVLLRGFDRDLVGKVQAHLEAHGVRIRAGRLPARLDRQPDGRVRVTLDDGTSEDFDTVVAAVGRYADTKGAPRPAPVQTPPLPPPAHTCAPPQA